MVSVLNRAFPHLAKSRRAMGMCADIGVPRPRGHFRILRLEEHGSGCQIKLLRPLASSKSLLQLCALKLFGYFYDEQIQIACGVKYNYVVVFGRRSIQTGLCILEPFMCNCADHVYVFHFFFKV